MALETYSHMFQLHNRCLSKNYIRFTFEFFTDLHEMRSSLIELDEF